MSGPFYRFPVDNVADYPGTIHFARKIIQPPDIELTGGASAFFDRLLENGNNDEIARDGIGVVVRNRQEIERGGVTLFLPQAIQLNDGIQYDNNVQLGIIGATAEAAINSGGGLSQALSQAFQSGVSSFTDIFSRVSAPDLARLAIVRAANNLPAATGIADVAGATLRTAVNPNRRTLFRGVAPREFSFQFKLIANSAREAQEIERIISFFRTEMYPKEIPIEGISAGYEYPNMFQIRMKYNGNKVGYNTKNCFLSNFQQVINPTSMGFHVDGKPSEVDITMTFLEETTLSKKDIRGGY